MFVRREGISGRKDGGGVRWRGRVVCVRCSGVGGVGILLGFSEFMVFKFFFVLGFYRGFRWRGFGLREYSIFFCS